MGTNQLPVSQTLLTNTLKSNHFIDVKINIIYLLMFSREETECICTCFDIETETRRSLRRLNENFAAVAGHKTSDIFILFVHSFK